MGEAVVVRQAGLTDVAAAAEVWYASHLVRRNGRALPKERHDLALARMSDPSGLLLIAEDFGSPYDPGPGGSLPPPVIGTILGEAGREDDGSGPPVPGLLHLALLSVHPDHWGRHVGRLLMEGIIVRASALGYRRAQLWAHADNAVAGRLYRATGFRRTGRARIDDWGELVVHHQRELQPGSPG
ncbi:GNAT family N-acetyltransferase [Peterkaempfera sp. SMS 1(5)a]|uniref:GNAT family N-acetyltransferase n=1 Tax=Peterkaempfera podocarpi TaxID=3232308 RepID=UPI00366B5B67